MLFILFYVRKQKTGHHPLGHPGRLQYSKKLVEYER